MFYRYNMQDRSITVGREERWHQTQGMKEPAGRKADLPFSPGRQVLRVVEAQVCLKSHLVFGAPYDNVSRSGTDRSLRQTCNDRAMQRCSNGWSTFKAARIWQAQPLRACTAGEKRSDMGEPPAGQSRGIYSGRPRASSHQSDVGKQLLLRIQPALFFGCDSNISHFGSRARFYTKWRAGIPISLHVRATEFSIDKNQIPSRIQIL